MTRMLQTYADPFARSNLAEEERECSASLPHAPRSAVPTSTERVERSTRWWVQQYESAGRALMNE